MKKEEWTKGEIAKWRSEGVVDKPTADVLLAKYRMAESRIGWGASIAGTFGSLLIGLGVIAIFAANWDHLGRAERAIVAIMPLLACGVAAIVAKARGWRTMTLWEPLGTLWFVATIAATCLVAQTYNVGGRVPDLVLFVAVLTLPVVWITRSVVAMSAWPELTFIYVGLTGDWWSGADANTIVNAFLMLAVSIPAYVVFLRRHPPRTTLVLCQIAMGLVYSFGMAWMLVVCFDCSMQIGILVFWGCSALVLGAGAAFRLSVWPMVAIITASLAATPSVSSKVHISIYAASLALAVVTTAYGIVKRRLAFMNIGAMLLLYLILAKFFMSEADFTVKAIAREPIDDGLWVKPTSLWIRDALGYIDKRPNESDAEFNVRCVKTGFKAVLSFPDQLFVNEKIAPDAEKLLQKKSDSTVAVYRVYDGRIVLTDIEIDGKPILSVVKE